MLATTDELRDYNHMIDQLQSSGEQLEQLRLSELEAGDILTITTGAGEQAWNYTFIIEDPEGTWPKGTLSAISPDGSFVEPVNFSLHGSGKWTTREQNPVQKQTNGFTASWESLYKGEYLVGFFEGNDERSVFDKRGQEITNITLQRS